MSRSCDSLDRGPVDRGPVDRGAIDVSIQMLFGAMCVLLVLGAVFESTAYWHARNVFAEAAAEGARVGAAFDGDCAGAIRAASAMVAEHAGSWGRGATVGCTEGAVVMVTVSGRTPGLLGAALGFQARVRDVVPKEA